MHPSSVGHPYSPTQMNNGPGFTTNVLVKAWLVGAGVLLVATFTPWAHISMPLLGTIVLTGFDATGWLLPLLAFGTGTCAAVEANGRGSRLSRCLGLSIAALSVVAVGYEFFAASTQLAGLLQQRHSPEPMTSVLAQLSSAGLDFGLFLAILGSLTAVTASAIVTSHEVH
jgi:hypothetical protein